MRDMETGRRGAERSYRVGRGCRVVKGRQGRERDRLMACAGILLKVC